MRLKILSVGRDRADPAAPMVADYCARISRFLPIEEIVLKADREDRIAARMLAEKKRGCLLVALDERGRELDTLAFARLVEKWMGGGVLAVTFAVGGADGHAPAVREGADLVLALSRMTLPHRLARLLLAEQVYRALCVARGVPYQK
ncbi:MAG: 23S rRNA (pseudouridine(1915)-N(3))-methyltransferase RlmH [Deltaproteobacteria bacterium]|nr:23S rRNA (pseudouridine(1915)-N(3))-methyltransferase RlmH [Deltaproteobacteria bacterium]